MPNTIRSHTYRILLVGVCLILLLMLGACRKGTSGDLEANPTETLPAIDIPPPTAQSSTPTAEPEGFTPPDAAPPTLDFGDVQRTEVLTTTVASGDTVYAIALRYDLKPESIAWANPDIMAAPWLIQPGQALTILPVDGVYHLVQPGETATQIASRYGVDAGTLVNPWNDLAAGADPAAGQWLVIPGGQGPDLEWEPPPSSP
jgi:LysM repeat protein